MIRLHEASTIHLIPNFLDYSPWRLKIAEEGEF
jgi:hypothetical protein